VTVKLFANFRHGRFTVRVYEFDGRITALQILQELAILLAEVGIFLCNGRHGDVDTELVEGDSCSIFPKVGGG